MCSDQRNGVAGGRDHRAGFAYSCRDVSLARARRGVRPARRLVRLGLSQCAHWVSWRCGIALVSAREHLRVAHRLEQLPLIRAAFSDGRLSYSQVRALTRAEQVEKEEELLSLARHA